MNEELRGELVARAMADKRAVGAVYDNADHHRAAFEAGHAGCSTPWPFAIFEWKPEDQAPLEVQRELATVRDNAARLKIIVEEYGWPGRDLVGEDGAGAAWLLLQHAGAGVSTIGTQENRAFRRACVPLLEEAVRTGDAHPRHLAYTVDGICSVEGRGPVYAVLISDYQVVDGSPVFRCPVDIEAIDRNRAGIGLPPLAEDVSRRACGEQVQIPAPHWPEPWGAASGA